MPVSGIGKQTCSVARTVGLIGDPWTLMILRDLFLGSRRFDEFQIYTGASPHLLSVRLRRMADDGLIVARAYQDNPPRHEYHLTEKGIALWPVITAMREWGDRWNRAPGAPPVKVTHRGCGGLTHIHHSCEACGEEVDARALEVVLSTKAKAERRAMAERGTRPSAEKRLAPRGARR